MSTQIGQMKLDDVAELFGCTRLAVYRADQLPLVGNLLFWEGTKGAQTLEQTLNGAETWVLASDGEHPQRVLVVAIDGRYVAPGELAYEELERQYRGRFTPEMAAAYNSIGKTF